MYHVVVETLICLSILLLEFVAKRSLGHRSLRVHKLSCRVWLVLAINVLVVSDTKSPNRSKDYCNEYNHL